MSRQPGNAQQQQQQPQQKNPSEEWSDEDLVGALRRLDDLHTKLINLRTVIPRVTLPFSKSYPSPSEFYDDLATRAQGASEEVLAFNSLWVDTEPVFKKAEASRANNPDGIKGLSVHDTFMPDEVADDEVEEEEVGVDTKQKGVDDTAAEGAAGQPEAGEEQDEDEVVTTETDIQKVIDEFTRKFQDIEVEFKSGDGEAGERSLKLTLPKPTGLLFTIDILPPPSFPSPMNKSDAAPNTRRFIVTSIVNPKEPGRSPRLFTSILRAVTTRPHAGNLQMLLEMLASYRSLFTTPCSKCNKLTAGNKVELPVVRRESAVPEQTPAVGAGSNTANIGAGIKKKKEKVWVSLHEVCM